MVAMSGSNTRWQMTNPSDCPSGVEVELFAGVRVEPLAMELFHRPVLCSLQAAPGERCLKAATKRDPVGFHTAWSRS